MRTIGKIILGVVIGVVLSGAVFLAMNVEEHKSIESRTVEFSFEKPEETEATENTEELTLKDDYAKRTTVNFW